MELSTDAVLATVKSLPNKSICGKTCVSFMDIAHALHIKGDSLPMLIKKFDSLEAAGKVTLIRGPFGLIAGVIAS